MIKQKERVRRVSSRGEKGRGRDVNYGRGRDEPGSDEVVLDARTVGEARGQRSKPDRTMSARERSEQSRSERL